MRYSIRRAAPSDAFPIQALLAAHRLPSDGIHPHLDTFTVASARVGAGLGSAGLELYSEHALLRSVAVKDAHRGAGIGGQLTEAALHLARHRGMQQVYLLTETATTFFPRYGFAPVERDAVPTSIQQTEEFTTLCSHQAVVMHRAL